MRMTDAELRALYAMPLADRLTVLLGALAGTWHFQSAWGLKVHAIFDQPFERGRFKRDVGTALCSGKVEDDRGDRIFGCDARGSLDICPACRRMAERLRNPVKRKPRIRRHKWAEAAVKETFCLACGLDVTRGFNSYERRYTWDCRLAGMRWSRVPTCEAVWPAGWVPRNAPAGFIHLGETS